jgi:hypothetical protein
LAGFTGVFKTLLTKTLVGPNQSAPTADTTKDVIKPLSANWSRTTYTYTAVRPRIPTGNITTTIYDANGKLLRTIGSRPAPSHPSPDNNKQAITTEVDNAVSRSRRASVINDGTTPAHTVSTPCIAFGPELPDWGSWAWVGADLAKELSKHFGTVTFRADEIPKCDVAVFVKHAPSRELVEEVSRRAAVVYCPVDYYGAAAMIDADADMLRRCSRILVHCERLRRYFEPYAPVEYIDHHVKFAEELSVQNPPKPALDGEGTEVKIRKPDVRDFVLWVGVRSNLPAMVDWVNRHSLPLPLRVLTNPETSGQVPSAAEFGFARNLDIEIEEWTPERHVELTREARAAIDIKGNDFRSRHKPPAKAIDFIASGVPLAMNPDSSTVEHLARMGFDVASPLNTDRWLSGEYLADTQRFGAALREVLSLERVGRRWRRILDELVAQKRR